MQIIQAKTEDYGRVRGFYHSLIDAMRGAEYFPGWEKDIYPAPEELQRAIDSSKQSVKLWIMCVAAGGKFLILQVLREAWSREVLLIADGAAFGLEIDRVKKFITIYKDLYR